jgi:hypothetical protein
MVVQTLLGLLADVTDLPTSSSFLENRPLLWGGGAVAGLFLVVVVVWLSGGKKKAPAETGLDEHLADYPPAPPGPGKRVTVQGLPARLRLVVVAPAGKRTITLAEVEGLLDGLVPGLAEVVRQDKPRIRLWPPQLSQQGFAPTFGRHTHRPETAGQPSPWVLVAGPARTQGQQVLVGLAFHTEKPVQMDLIVPGPLPWTEIVRVG